MTILIFYNDDKYVNNNILFKNLDEMNSNLPLSRVYLICLWY